MSYPVTTIGDVAPAKSDDFALERVVLATFSALAFGVVAGAGVTYFVMRKRKR